MVWDSLVMMRPVWNVGVAVKGNGDVGAKVANELSIDTTSAIIIWLERRKLKWYQAQRTYPVIFLNFRRDEMCMSYEKSRRGKWEETIKAKRYADDNDTSIDFDDIWLS